MRLIQNTTLQGFNIPFNTPQGPWDFYLRPNQTVSIPESYSSIILDNLIKRRMVRVTKIEDS